MVGFVMEMSAPKPEYCLLYFGDYCYYLHVIVVLICIVSCIK